MKVTERGEGSIGLSSEVWLAETRTSTREVDQRVAYDRSKASVRKDSSSSSTVALEERDSDSDFDACKLEAEAALIRLVPRTSGK